jgi:hypothetical protein
LVLSLNLVSKLRDNLNDLGAEFECGPKHSVIQALLGDLRVYDKALGTELPSELMSFFSGELGGRFLNASSISLEEIEKIRVCLTVSHDLVAESGSVVLVSRNLNERRATTLPDRLLIYCENFTVHNSVRDFVANRVGLFEPNTTVTLLSGPSRTADVEQILVKGVHGPRYVKVFLVVDSDHRFP